jgi:hypothetical protein
VVVVVVYRKRRRREICVKGVLTFCLPHHSYRLEIIVH